MHRVTSLQSVQQFFQPHTASTTVTIRSMRTQAHYTFDIKRKAPHADGTADEVWYVDLLSGPNNRKDYAPLAVLTRTNGKLRYHHASKSRIGADAPSAVALRWTIERVVVAASEEALAQVEVFHEGRCGRCGRKLTTPTSVELGFGPECAERIGVG